MFLPGLGYPMRPKDMTDKEWDEIVQGHERAEKIGGWLAAIVLVIGAAAFIAFWALFFVRFTR